MNKQAVTASTIATGGAGTNFEYQVAAVIMAHLVTETSCPGLDAPVRAVGLQQGHRHYLDDIVTYSSAERVGPSIAFQVKINLSPTGKDKEFRENVKNALKTIVDSRQNEYPDDERLGLIVGERSKENSIKQLRRLADCARSHSITGQFVDSVYTHTNQEIIKRYEHVREAVEYALDSETYEFANSDEATHQLLARLTVWSIQAEEGGADRRTALGNLKLLATDYGVSEATIFRDLINIAQQFGPHGGVFEAGLVRRELRRLQDIGYQKDEVAAAKLVDPDAMVRGPIAALALTSDVAQANVLFESGEPEAVTAYSEIAAALDEKYESHAAIFRRKQADALDRIGQIDRATTVRVEVAWNHLDRAQPWEAGFALHGGVKPVGENAKLQDQRGIQARRIMSAAEHATWVAKGSELHGFIEAFDSLHVDDLYIARAATFLAEELLTVGRYADIESRTEIFRQVATSAREDKASARNAIRIEMCLADALRQWDLLLTTVRKIYSPALLPWVEARYARYCALNGDGATATHYYSQAIERACDNDMYDDAAHWLYAHRTARYWNDEYNGSDDEHPRAQELQQFTKPSVLPGTPSLSELAFLGAAQSKDRPGSAQQRLRRLLWQAVIRAYLPYEITASQLLGDLATQDNEPTRAIQYYVRAGRAKPITKAARLLPERKFSWTLSEQGHVHDQRAARFAAASATSDLIPDIDAQQILEEATIQIDQAMAESRRSNLYTEAIKALCKLTPAAKCSQAPSVLRCVSPILSEKYAADLATVRKATRATLFVAQRHACVRTEALSLLVRCTFNSREVAAEFLDRESFLRNQQEWLGEYLDVHNHLGIHRASLAAVIAGIDLPFAKQYATSHVYDLLNASGVEPNREHSVFNEYFDQAILSTILPQEIRLCTSRLLLQKADSASKPTVHGSHLGALHEYLADKLDQASKERLFAEVISRVSKYNDQYIVSYLVLCASKLASSCEQFEKVERLGMPLLASTSVDIVWRTALALADTPPESKYIDPSQLAVHEQPALRWLAVKKWHQTPEVLSAQRFEELAHDEDPRVRRVLAESLRNVHSLYEPAAAAIAQLRFDPRRSVRQALWEAHTTTCSVD